MGYSITQTPKFRGKGSNWGRVSSDNLEESNKPAPQDYKINEGASGEPLRTKQEHLVTLSGR